MTRAEVLATVETVLSDAVRESGHAVPPISEASHILADLGLTSLDVAEVAIGLEGALGIGEFPITDWLKKEGQRSDTGALTVGSLVDTCLELMAASNAPSSASEGTRKPGAGPAGVSSNVATKASAPIAWTVFAVALCAAIVATVLALR